MDKYSKEARSYMMSRIRSSGTKPEETVRKYLFSRGLRYRKNVKTLPGTPDIVFPKYKTVVFVNGCFWHGHENCRCFRMPKSNVEYWEKKISRNIARDKAAREELSALGWNVITVWECELKKDRIDSALESLYQNIVANLPAAYSIAGEEAPAPAAAESEPEYGAREWQPPAKTRAPKARYKKAQAQKARQRS